MLLKGEFFLAWRYLKPQKSMISLLTYTSLLGPILGVGILIVVVSVMNGIPRELEKKFISYNAHLTVTGTGSLNNVSSLLQHIEQSHSYKSSPVTIGPVLIETKNGDSEVLLTKGILPEKDKDVSKLKDMMTDDAGNSFFIKPNEVIISKNIKDLLKLNIGDEVVLHSPEKYKNQLNGAQPEGNPVSAAKFKIAGIFSTGVPEIDKNFMVTHLDAANNLMLLKNGQATQIEIALKNPEKAEEIAIKLKEDKKFKDLRITPWQQQHNVRHL
ncbi:MAG: ABC transporter permease, partial [Lentisphaeraceae bacterium]|nr:ABC transporter permease [Lentisphaeraceae bacterium]